MMQGTRECSRRSMESKYSRPNILLRPILALRKYLAWRKRAKRMAKEDGYIYD
jgi:hypothetical protein